MADRYRFAEEKWEKIFIKKGTQALVIVSKKIMHLYPSILSKESRKRLIPLISMVFCFAFQAAENKKTGLVLLIRLYSKSQALKSLIILIRCKVCKNFILHHPNSYSFLSLPRVISYSETWVSIWSFPFYSGKKH